jgi:hypothetical protein
VIVSSDRIARVGYARAIYERAWVGQQPNARQLRQGWKARFRAERRGLYMAKRLLADIRLTIGEPQEWVPRVIKERKSGLFKASKEDKQFIQSFAATVAQALGEDPDDLVNAWKIDADENYAAFALSLGEESGQYTLDSLGLNKTFEWSHPRQIHRDVFAPRGDAILKGVWATHMQELARIITAATAPGSPWTIGQVVESVQSLWPEFTDMQAKRIARTETAWAWEQANVLTMRANGVRRTRWLIATGPSIGKTVGGRFVGHVCKVCLGNAADGWIPLGQSFTSGHTMPPGHPHCRCTLVPDIYNGWLPPAEPWTGGPIDAVTGQPVPPPLDLSEIGDLAEPGRIIFIPPGSSTPTVPVASATTEAHRSLTMGQVLFPVGQRVVWTPASGPRQLGTVTHAPAGDTGLMRVKLDSGKVKHFLDSDPTITPLWLAEQQ